MASSSTAFAFSTEANLFSISPLRRLPSQKRSLYFIHGLLLGNERRLPIGDVKSGRGVVVMAARKKRSSKQDNHSFAVKPDEATGPFPEQVLLKKKTIQLNGKSLPEFADAEEEKLYEFLNIQLESNLNLEKMRHYEVVYLIHEDHFDEVKTVISKVQEFVREKKGRIWRLNNWGLRRLAYKIKKAKNANYVLMNFELDAKYINDLKTMLDKDERIIRHLVMKRDEAETEDCPSPPELNTLRAGFMDEDDEDEDEVYDDDDELELEMAGYEDNQNDADENIIIIEDNDSEGSGLSLKEAMGLKSESKTI